MNRRLTPWLLLAMSLLIGCETIPVQQMSDARQAYRAAQAVGAEQYAPELFAEVETLMEDADRFLEERRYALAGKVAERARTLAIRARKEALKRGRGGNGACRSRSAAMFPTGGGSRACPDEERSSD